jgi:hypothetical protein
MEVDCSEYRLVTNKFYNRLFYSFGGSVSVGDTIQYFVVAQDLFTPPNVSSNPSTGFSGTSVSMITSAPTTPNQYKIVGLPLSGDYVISSSLFRQITGKDINFEKVTKLVRKEIDVQVPVEFDSKNRLDDKNSGENLQEKLLFRTERQIIQEEEIQWIPMLNGQLMKVNYMFQRKRILNSHFQKA